MIQYLRITVIARPSKPSSMNKLLVLYVFSCFIYGIVTQNTCLDQCGTKCFVDASAQRCRSCPARCDKCNDADSCITCASGYYLNKKKNCVTCDVAYCATCNKQRMCTQCERGYYLANSSSCVYCGYRCGICKSETSCKTCRSDFSSALYISAITGECNYCPDGCQKCKNPKVCTSCKSGFILKNSQCISCSTIDPNCASCDETTTHCTSCPAGFYLLKNKCWKCSAGCEKCTDETTCRKCYNGYFMNANHGCNRCISGCFACQNATTCSQCAFGYTFDSDKGKCTACETDCIRVDGEIAASFMVSNSLLAKTATLAGDSANSGIKDIDDSSSEEDELVTD